MVATSNVDLPVLCCNDKLVTQVEMSPLSSPTRGTHPGGPCTRIIEPSAESRNDFMLFFWELFNLEIVKGQSSIEPMLFIGIAREYLERPGYPP